MATNNPQPVRERHDSYLLEVANAVNTTLDLNTLLQRVAEMLKRIIDYEIFAILLLNEKTQESAHSLPGRAPSRGRRAHPSSRSARASPDRPYSAAKPCWSTT